MQTRYMRFGGEREKERKRKRESQKEKDKKKENMILIVEILENANKIYEVWRTREEKQFILNK